VSSAVGNESIATVSVVVDSTLPDKALVSPSDGDRVKGTVSITAESSAADLDLIVILVDGQQIGASVTSPFTVDYDTTARLDGQMEITAVTRDLAGNESSCSIHVTVNNQKVRLFPRAFDLKSEYRGKAKVRARVTGPNLGLMQPVSSHDVRLVVPGGGSVVATGSETWIPGCGL